jgi:membrane-associated protein
MELIHKLLGMLRDPGPLIEWAGYPGLFLIIFIETGALIFFLPGDSLLFVAGLYASRGALSLGLLEALLIPAAILGDTTSYYIGARIGPAIFKRPESRLFKPAHLKAAHDFYERHGGKAIILARFMPIVRTFVPVVAGVGAMPYKRFIAYNMIGGAAWVASMTIGGYFLGQIEFVAKHVDLIVVAIVVISVLPAGIAWAKQRFGAAAKATADQKA